MRLTFRGRKALGLTGAASPTTSINSSWNSSRPPHPNDSPSENAYRCARGGQIWERVMAENAYFGATQEPQDFGIVTPPLQTIHRCLDAHNLYDDHCSRNYAP